MDAVTHCEEMGGALYMFGGEQSIYTGGFIE